MAIEIVDFPMNAGGSFHSFLYGHQRVSIANARTVHEGLVRENHRPELGIVQQTMWLITRGYKWVFGGLEP